MPLQVRWITEPFSFKPGSLGREKLRKAGPHFENDPELTDLLEKYLAGHVQAAPTLPRFLLVEGLDILELALSDVVNSARVTSGGAQEIAAEGHSRDIVLFVDAVCTKMCTNRIKND